MSVKKNPGYISKTLCHDRSYIYLYDRSKMYDDKQISPRWEIEHEGGSKIYIQSRDKARKIAKRIAAIKEPIEDMQVLMDHIRSQP